VITARAFAGKHYAVYGLARSGLATVEALLASGARVTAWDGKEEARSSLQAKLVGRGTSEAGGGVNDAGPIPLHHPADGSPPHALHGEELTIADLDSADLSQFDSLVVTPGLPLNRHPIAQRAREANLEIIGDIELFARARPELPPHKVVGITGTNGKSTTTALIHHILKTAGVPTTMGGNIGLPILAQDPLPAGGVYVLELSSYQIDLTQSLDCDVAVLLNITPDHLDRYESFDAYADSKLRLFAMQTHGLIIMPERTDWMVKVGEAVRPGSTQTITFFDHMHGYLAPYASQQSQWKALQGPHNLENALAAIDACENLGVSKRNILDALKSFPGLPHRMERVREKDGVLFVNDSKATNAESAAPALAAFERIRWIIGGRAKRHSLGDTQAHLRNVIRAYTIGEAGPMLARLLRELNVSVECCETLENAVNRAAEDSLPGETVLLSPACASFDQFRDFEARGDKFRELVGAL
jgi:UDP-N-acetylmuramoylalanine--D-glutamate ligase